MDEQQVHEYIGESRGALKSIQSTLEKMETKLDDSAKFQAATQERLRQGATTFSGHSTQLKEHDNRLDKQEARKCPEVASGRLIASWILVATAIIGFIIAFFK